MYTKFKNLVEKILPMDALFACCFSILWNCIVYYGVRFTYGGRTFYDMTSFLEEKIPVLPWTVIIYYAFFPFVGINIFLLARYNKERLFRYVISDFLGKAVCLACFLIIPTTNIRPEVLGSDLGSIILRFLYHQDAANNLFPSIHCLDSWFVYLSFKKWDWAPKWYRIFNFILAVAICLSTLTTKQHVIPDVIVGVALAEISYYFAGKIQTKYRDRG